MFLSLSLTFLSHTICLLIHPDTHSNSLAVRDTLSSSLRGYADFAFSPPDLVVCFLSVGPPSVQKKPQVCWLPFSFLNFALLGGFLVLRDSRPQFSVSAVVRAFPTSNPSFDFPPPPFTPRYHGVCHTCFPPWLGPPDWSPPPLEFLFLHLPTFLKCPG